MDNQIIMIDITRLHAHPDNPRKDLGDLTELSASIAKSGVMQNLTVVPFEDESGNIVEGEYTIIIGHRRTAAAIMAGVGELPCIIRQMNKKEQLTTMIAENVQRNDLTIIEQADALQMMIDFGDTVEQVSKATGLSDSTIRRRLQLSKFDKSVLSKAIDGQISIRELEELSKVKDEKERNRLLNEYGTSSYAWDLKNSLSKQKDKEKEEKVREQLLSSGLTEISDQYNTIYNNTKNPYQRISGKDIVLVGDEQYFCISYGNVYFRRDKTEQDIEEEKEKTLANRRTVEERLEKWEKLKKLCENAYALRREYVLSISEARAITLLATIIKRNIGIFVNDEVSVKSYLWQYDTTVICGQDRDEEWDDDDVKERDIDEVNKHYPRSLLRHTYALYNDRAIVPTLYYESITYSRQEELYKVYEYLKDIGYQMSDEEKAIIEGTHELYEK